MWQGNSNKGNTFNAVHTCACLCMSAWCMCVQAHSAPHGQTDNLLHLFLAGSCGMLLMVCYSVEGRASLHLASSCVIKLDLKRGGRERETTWLDTSTSLWEGSPALGSEMLGRSQQSFPAFLCGSRPLDEGPTLDPASLWLLPSSLIHWRDCWTPS